jgi:hypothetical protein
MTTHADLVPPRPTSSRDEVRDRPDDLVPTLVPPTGTRSRSNAGRGSRTSTETDQDRDEVKSHPYRHPGTLWMPARLATHLRCGRPVLEAHVDGCPVQAEPWVLTAAGEFAAAVDGNRILLNLHYDADLMLSFRFAYHVGWSKLWPLAEHKCGHPVPAVDAAKSAVLIARLRPVEKENAQCDF